VALTFDPNEDISAPYVHTARPKVAILREQGVNSQVEMGAVMERVGFESHDVHMSDVLSGRVKLADFRGLVACGGFPMATCSARARAGPSPSSITRRRAISSSASSTRSDTFSLGVCNGCQMFAALKEIVPGARSWPRFVRNRGEQFEGRFSLVELAKSPSIFLRRHGWLDAADRRRAWRGPRRVRERRGREAFLAAGLVSARYIEGNRQVATTYPANPNGSPFGIAAVTNATAASRSPCRTRSVVPLRAEFLASGRRGRYSGWFRMFGNARRWVG
jgi:phosphoribosylformylglycinamidine synthase